MHQVRCESRPLDSSTDFRLQRYGSETHEFRGLSYYWTNTGTRVACTRSVMTSQVIIRSKSAIIEPVSCDSEPSLSDTAPRNESADQRRVGEIG
jgi:hypothetical protein